MTETTALIIELLVSADPNFTSSLSQRDASRCVAELQRCIDLLQALDLKPKSIQIRELRAAEPGLTNGQIARRLGTTLQNVNMSLKPFGWQVEHRRAKGKFKPESPNVFPAPAFLPFSADED